MYFSGAPGLLKLFMPSGLVWQIPTKDKSLYLTFDDGPVAGVTEEVLSVLKDFDAKATFFCVGDNVQKYPEIYKKILEAGHSTGNHTFHHLNGWKTADEEYFEDVKQCAELVDSMLFRPPYGRITRSQARYLSKKYKIIMWSALGGDFDPKVSAEKCIENILKSTREGSIIVLHDNQKSAQTMLRVLPQVLKYYSDKGFQFLPL